MFRNAIVAVLALAMTSAGQANPNGDYPGDFVNRSLDVGEFESVVLVGPIKTMVLTADQDSAEYGTLKLVGPPAMLDDVVAEVRDGKLHLGFRDGANWSWNPGGGVNAVAFSKPVRAIEVQGAGSIDVNRPDADEVTVSIGGAGMVELTDVKTAHLIAAIGGSGSLSAFGSADQVTYAIGGSGRIEGKRVRARSANIAIGGSGSVFADVSDNAQIQVSGSGRVEIVGGAQCQFPAGQARQIDCR